MCFFCGKYGHNKAICHTRQTIDEEDKEASEWKEAKGSERKEVEASNSTSAGKTEEQMDAALGPWMIA